MNIADKRGSAFEDVEMNTSLDEEKSSSSSSTVSGGEGRLTVRVFTAYGAIPLEGATVNIRARDSTDSDGGIVVSLGTDRSGLTPTVALPAPPRSLAQVPGNVKPFSTYAIDVLLEGYYTAVFENVPIYDGVSSLQNAAMIPLPENGYPDARRPDGKLVYPEASAPGL